MLCLVGTVRQSFTVDNADVRAFADIISLQHIRDMLFEKGRRGLHEEEEDSEA